MLLPAFLIDKQGLKNSVEGYRKMKRKFQSGKMTSATGSPTGKFQGSMTLTYTPCSIDQLRCDREK